MSEQNAGIQISGGTFNANQVAVGTNAQAAQVVYTTEQSTKQPDQRAPVKVLLVFANPLGSERLRLEAEDRAIREAIRLSRYRDNILLTIHHAATIHDLRRALLDDDFQIVHLAGHGGTRGLILEDEAGRAHLVPQEALADLFRAYKDTIRCVLLNACYSVTQGNLISPAVPYTIAIEGTLYDKTALEFARGFYDAIGAGKDITFAYEEGCRTVRLVAPGAPFTSTLLTTS